MRQWMRRAFWCACCTTIAAGCADQNKKMDMASMKPPPRPAELDQLDKWVGNWSSSGEMCMNGKTMKMTGTSTIAWDCDKRVLVERANSEMEGMGKMSEMVLYTWDSDDKHFNTYYFSGMGEASRGHMMYDAKMGGYKMKGKGKDPMSGKTMIFEGAIRMPDNNTMNFEFVMWDSLHLSKQGEGKGTAHRS